MPADDAVDLCGSSEDEDNGEAAAQPAANAASAGPASAEEVIVLSSDSDDDGGEAATGAAPAAARSGRGTKRRAPSGASARQAPSKPRGVIDLSGAQMKVTVEGGAAAAAAPAAAPAASSSGGGATPRPEDAWKCSICLDEMVNPASTTCGHVFCHDCIRNALKAAPAKGKKCPQCRKKLTLKQIHRIYLPEKPAGGGPPDSSFPAC